MFSFKFFAVKRSEKQSVHRQYADSGCDQIHWTLANDLFTRIVRHVRGLLDRYTTTALIAGAWSLVSIETA